MDASSTSCCIRYLFGIWESLSQPYTNIRRMCVGWICSRFWFIYSSSCSVYIYIHQHLIAAWWEPPHFFTCVWMHQICHYMGGGERMSWRRYVFLHRIHPHSILIGFSLLRRRKEREQRWEEEWIMKKWSEGVNVLLRVSIFTFPAMPSHHCGRHNDYTPTHTSMLIHFSWPLVLLCGVVPCLYWALLNNAAANIPPALDKTVSQEHNNNAKPKPSPSDCQTLPEQWTNWCNLGNGTENVCREKERERVYMCVYKYESEHACECVCVRCMLMVYVKAWRANALGFSR